MHRPRAFTLVELLVVISIAVLLLSSLLPVLGKARDVARDIRCKAVLRGMITATNAYVADEHEYLVHGENSPYATSDRPWYQTTATFFNYYTYFPTFQKPIICGVGQLMLNEYLPEKTEAFGCPQSDFREPSVYNTGSTLYTGKTSYYSYRYGLDPTHPYYYRNANLAYSPTDTSTYSVRGAPMRTSNLRSSSENAASFDASPQIAPFRMAFFADEEAVFNNAPTLGGVKAIVGTAPGVSPLPYWGRKHLEGFNAAYVDGHVQFFADPNRALVWGTNKVPDYGSQFALPTMDLK